MEYCWTIVLERFVGISYNVLEIIVEKWKKLASLSFPAGGTALIHVLNLKQIQLMRNSLI